MNFAIGIKSDEGIKFYFPTGDKVDLSRRLKAGIYGRIKKRWLATKTDLLPIFLSCLYFTDKEKLLHSGLENQGCALKKPK